MLPYERPKQVKELEAEEAYGRLIAASEQEEVDKLSRFAGEKVIPGNVVLGEE